MSRIRYDWSKLCPDLLRSVLEGLSTKDYHRARTVCSNWYSVSTTCRRPLYPWRIVLNESSTLLMDPGEDKTHEIDHPGINFAQSDVVASCSNWLLLVGSRLDFYLLNVFTRKRINLPSMESSILGQATFKGKDDWEHFIARTDIVSYKKSSVLWINERTEDFVVAWIYKKQFLFSYKKGDDSWLSLQGITCLSIAYKDYKLYVYTMEGCIKIIDLSGDLLTEIIEGNPYRNHRFEFVSKPGECVWKRRVAITNSGEVLIVLSLKGLQENGFFYIFKMNLESGNWEIVDSLGGEMMIYGHGVTIRAPIKDIDDWGIKSNSICFCDDDLWPSGDQFILNRQIKCGVFDLVTSTITWPKPLDAPFLKSFWFVPGYA